jgi:putative nucleotidyltransferase with HDIG domain
MINKKNAIQLLNDAAILNPGTWINHSLYVAKAAEKITKKIRRFDSDRAFVVGLLHDMGRRNGVSYIKHVYDGYMFLKDKDKLAADICITHSFPNKNINEYQGKIDIDNNTMKELSSILHEIDYDYYHKLIILCDSYGTDKGFVTLEKRWVDVIMRYGFSDYTIQKWRAILDIRNTFNDEYKINVEKELRIQK